MMRDVGAGELFDRIVHRGMSPEALLGAEDGESWEIAALPRSATPLPDLTSGSLVVQRALGEQRLGTLHVLGQDIEARELYGEDGLIRPNVLVLTPRKERAWTASDVDTSERDEEWNLGALFRAKPRAASFPARRSDAAGGRAFMEKIKGERDPGDWDKRESAIVAEIVAGNMPDSLLTWITIDLAYKDNARDLKGSVQVLPDYLAVGSDDDYVHVPLDPVSAQRVADKLDAMLPTARICHAIYKQAAEKNRIAAIERDYWQQTDSLRRSAKPGRQQSSTAAYLEHSEAIQARMKSAGVSLGELVAGHKKDVVISKRLHADPNKIAFHGFYDGKGYPHEPCYENKDRAPKPTCDKETAIIAHYGRFSDYSQGVRLVNPWMMVNGERKKVADVLADKDLSLLISNEGPIVPPRIPRLPAAPARRSSETAFEAGEQVAAPAASAVTIPAAAGLGTSKTVAPIADLSPQRQMDEILDRELALIARARIVAEWINKKFSATIDQALADSALMARLDLSKDQTLLGKMRPFPGNKIPETPKKKRKQLFTADAVLAELRKAPADAAGLLPVFELLRHYGVVLLPPGDSPGARKVIASVTRVEARLERERFDTETAAVEQRAIQFKRGVGDMAIIHHCVAGELIPADMWSDKANPPLEVAKPVLALLRRLRERNRLWRAGTYPSHFWNDFSVDIFVIAGIRSGDGFWDRAKMRDFFQALNAACEQDAAPGRFAWKAIYNDEALAKEMDGLYGAGRVLYKVPGHGPGGDMHVHLDLRPLTVPFDAATGFWIKKGRVVLKPPATAGEEETVAETEEEAFAETAVEEEAFGETAIDEEAVEDTTVAEAVPRGGSGAFRHDPLGGDAGDNVEARWNVDAATPSGSTIDLVVYLHGYGELQRGETQRGFLARKAVEAGLDLADSSGAVLRRTSRPTLVLIPRGRHDGGRGWFFDRLPDRAAFDALVNAGVLWLCTKVLGLPSGSTLRRGRLTLMAHSGGGAGMAALLKGSNRVDPDEVVCFDSLYGGETPVREWAVARLASSSASTSGLRVFYTGCSAPSALHPGGQWVPRPGGKFALVDTGSWSYSGSWILQSTEPYARRVHDALERALKAASSGAALADRFRVQRTSVAHGDIPAQYSPLLLDDIAATLPKATPPPAKTSRPACVANDDWLTARMRKPGGEDPPPPKPTPPGGP